MKIKNKKQHFANIHFEDIDNMYQSQNYFLPVLQESIKNINLKKSYILDVGCGTGIFLQPLIDSGCLNCYGVDGANDYVNRAIDRGYKDIKLVNDLCSEDLPFEKDFFDFVICKDVFEHLINPIYVLKNIRRVLKKKGFFLLHVPNHFSLYGRLKFVFTNNIDTFSFFKNENRWTFPHIRFYEYDDSIKILSENGFALEKDLSYNFPSFPILSRFKIFKPFLKYLVKNYPNQFAGGFTFLLTKN